MTYCRSQRKHGQPSTITNHLQFLTKYSKRLKDKPFSKHYRINLDLDDLKKARYPRIPQRLTERLLMCFYRRQETSMNPPFSDLSITHGSYVFLVMAFYSILFLYASSLISKKYRGDTVKASKMSLFTTQPQYNVTNTEDNLIFTLLVFGKS